MQTRNTAQLKIVQEALCSLANHPTADEVYALVHESHPTISKATVYRALNKLASQGAALKVFAPLGADHFDHVASPHAHVQCEGCGKIEDVMIPLGANAIAQAEEISGFQISSMNVQFIGICSSCQKER